MLKCLAWYVLLAIFLQSPSPFAVAELNSITCCATRCISGPSSISLLSSLLKDANSLLIFAALRNSMLYWRCGTTAAWVPFFDDMNAIIFLAPVSCFDQVLMEDQSVNRLVSQFHIAFCFTYRTPRLLISCLSFITLATTW